MSQWYCLRERACKGVPVVLFESERTREGVPVVLFESERTREGVPVVFSCCAVSLNLMYV